MHRDLGFVSMAFRGGAKRFLSAILSNKLLSSSCSTTTSGHGFTTLISKRIAFAQATEVQVLVVICRLEESSDTFGSGC